MELLKCWIYGIFCCFLLNDALCAGAICEFKIKQAQEGIRAYEQKRNYDPDKLAEARKELDTLLKHCDDEAILQDVQEHIKRTKNKLDAENLRLANALQAQDQHRIFQAKLAYKIAEIEYIAARQEELRLKDLLKPIPKK